MNELSAKRARDLQVGDDVAGYGVVRYFSPHFHIADLVWVASGRLPDRQPDLWPADALVAVRPRKWQRTITYETTDPQKAEAWRAESGKVDEGAPWEYLRRVFGEVTEL